jgi:hypothetical protein
VPDSLTGEPLTLRFTSSTQSVGDDGGHNDFALDDIQVSRVDGGNWPLLQEVRDVQRQPDGGTHVTLNWLSNPNRYYRVESSGDLVPPWQPVQSGIAATPPVNSILLEVPAGVSRTFFRVVEE